MVEFYQKYFPPTNSNFKCFTSKSESSEHDSLLYLPDILAYKCTLVVLIVGILLGFLFVFLSFKSRITKLPINNKQIFEKYLKDIHYNYFVLSEILDKKIDTVINDSIEKKDDNIELTIFSNNLKNNLTINDNINRNQNLSNEDFKKLTDAGYHVGRVGYPSASILKQNLSKTVSLESLSSHDVPVTFRLDSFSSNNNKFNSSEPNNIEDIHSIVEEEIAINEARVRKSMSSF